jgi:methylated-DNA-[protein]-cysteine S-methyltransferase
MKALFFYDFPIGRTGICESEGKITHVLFIENDDTEISEVHSDFSLEETPLIKETKKQLDEYFEGKRKEFSLPLEFNQGTEFQKRIWNLLLQIPYGETCSYKELAAMAGNPKASRAVGGANNKNPISIIVPCHRVIGADGSLVGYGGGLEIKKRLLELEEKDR